MCLHYANQAARFIIGTASVAATLTGSFNDNKKIFTSGGMTQLTLYVAYTPAESGRIMSLQVEGSPDGVTFFPLASIQDNSPFDGTVVSSDFIKTIVSTGSSEVRRRFATPVADLFLRVSVKEDGANFGTMTIINLISGK